jgi:hypothetical protein
MSIRRHLCQVNLKEDVKRNEVGAIETPFNQYSQSAIVGHINELLFLVASGIEEQWH